MNINQHKPEDFTKVADYLAGEATEEEKRELDRWLNESSDHQSFFSKMKKIWEASQIREEGFCPNIARAWEKVKPATGGRVVPFTAADAKPSRPALRWPYYVAASVLLLVGVGLFLQEDHIIPKLTLESTRMEANEKGEFILADGSAVWLNSNSRLYYPDNFGSERKVYLEGEAYFEIKANPDKPFRIITGKGITEVLGTAFNLNSSGDKVTVTVTEGTVALYPEKKSENKIILQKGESGFFDQSNNALDKIVLDDPNFLSWKTGVLSFNNSSLKTVGETLAKHYDKNILIKGEVSEACQLTSTFDNKPLEEVLKLIALTLDVEVLRDGEQIILESKGC